MHQTRYTLTAETEPLYLLETLLENAVSESPGDQFIEKIFPTGLATVKEFIAPAKYWSGHFFVKKGLTDFAENPKRQNPNPKEAPTRVMTNVDDENRNPQFQISKEGRKNGSQESRGPKDERARNPNGEGIWTRISRMGANFGGFVLQNVGEGN